MPLGQSFAVRFGIVAACNTLGIPPQVSTQAGRVAGWLTAHCTLDHHSQCAYEGMLSTMGEDRIAKVVMGTASRVLQGVPLEDAIGLAFQSIPED